MTYLLIPSDSSDLKIDPEALSRSLQDQWPMVEIRQKIPVGTMLLEWSINTGNIHHVGMLHGDRRTLSIDDYGTGLSEFAVWYAKTIAENHDIFIYHDSDAHLEIRVTSKSEVAEIKDRLEGNV